MPWNWFQDKDSSFFAGTERRRLQNRNRGSAIRNRDRCSAPSVRIPCPGAGRMQPPPTGQGAMRRQPRSDAPPTGRKAPAAPRGAGGAGRNRNRGSFSRNRVGRRCGAMRYLCIGRKGAPPMREVDAQLLHTSHNTSPDRHPRPASSRRGSPPPSDQRTKKTNSHECKTPYANRPAGGCGDASARARSSCPAKHNTDNHG